MHDSCGQLGAPAPPPGYKKPEAPIGGFERRAGGTTIGGVSILKPKELGGITAYDMTTGDKTWWIPNGGQLVPVVSEDPLFKGVKLPPAAPARGHAQVITTKTLVIYGTGRSGGPPKVEPQLYAVDKATGKQLAAVPIPSKTSAPPMTFMHKGKQVHRVCDRGRREHVTGGSHAPGGDICRFRRSPVDRAPSNAQPGVALHVVNVDAASHRAGKQSTELAVES